MAALVSQLTMSPLNEIQIEERMAELHGWHRGEGPEIVRELDFADFAAAIAYVNRVAELAEAANHHPDILVYAWNMVRLTLTTHSEGGLTNADFKLASEIDQLG